MKKPNFFIPGAPKSGTSSLYYYLRGHPNVFMSEPKEPHFFASDLGDFRSTTSLENYKALYEQADSQHKVVGEASTMYLFSDCAMEQIYNFNPQARLVVMLRNPVELVQSFHSHLLYLRHETEKNFQIAWDLQEERRAGRGIPRKCRGVRRLQYREVGLLGSQVKRLLNVFPRSQIQFVFIEDLAKNTLSTYRKTLAFLDLPDDGRTEFGHHNERKKNQFPFLVELFRKKPDWLNRLYTDIKDVLGIDGFGVASKLIDWQTSHVRKHFIHDDMIDKLIETFRDDIRLLSEVTDRNLDHWVNQRVDCTTEEKAMTR